MFFIYADNLKHGKVMLGVVALIIAQVSAYLLNEFFGDIENLLSIQLSFVPVLFSIKPFTYSYTLITANFLHLDFLHLIGNVIFFLAFGRTLEKLFGTKIFLLSFIFIGALAFLGSWLINPNSSTPIIGSSGSISFLMGVYLILFPKSKLRLIFLIPPFFKRFWLPSYLFLIYWVLLQVYDGMTDTNTVGGVAYATHIFGFIIGIACGIAWKENAEDTDRKLLTLSEDI